MPSSALFMADHLPLFTFLKLKIFKYLIFNIKKILPDHFFFRYDPVIVLVKPIKNIFFIIFLQTFYYFYNNCFTFLSLQKRLRVCTYLVQYIPSPYTIKLFNVIILDMILHFKFYGNNACRGSWI
jgi:hypothetical protein